MSWSRAGAVVAPLIAFALAPAVAGSAPASCAAGDLALSLGPRISPETGENGMILRLANRAAHVCTLSGFPGVSFYGGGRRLRFKAVWGGRYGTGGRPRTVALRTGQHASFLVAKYRCDIGSVRTATEVRVYPPNTTRQLRLRLRPSAIVGAISYCRAYRGPDRDDPGNVIDISPVSRAAYPYTPD